MSGRWNKSKPGFFSRFTTFSHIDQFGSIKTLTSFVCTRNDACPIQVMQISPCFSFGKSGRPPLPARFVKSEGMRTLVRKFRLCQSALGRSPTRVELLGADAPFSVA